MSYIGAEPTTAAFPFDQFSGTGAATSFTLTYAPASATSILVAISGVTQNPNLYSVIGTTLTFSPAPPAGTNNISVLYLGLPAVIGVPDVGSVTPAMLSTGGPSWNAGGTLSVAAISDSGNLTFTGTGNRITGDFSNATLANSVLFQTSTTNGSTRLRVMPNGTGTDNALDLFGSTDLANSSRLSLRTSAADMALVSTREGTGTYLPMTFNTGGSERVRVDTLGNVGIGIVPSLTGGQLQVSAAANNASARFSGNANGMAVLNQNGLTVYTNLSAGSTDTTLVAGNTASTYMAFGVHNGTAYNERMRIDSSGRLLVGATSALGTLTVSSTGAGTKAFFTNTTDADFAISCSSGVTMLSPSTGILALGTSGTERARIDSSGNLLVGTTSTFDNVSFLRVQALGGVSTKIAGTGLTSQMSFFNDNGRVGYIGTNGTTTSYNTSSDYRLKEAIAPMTGALAKVALLKPVTYKWKVDGSDGQGFIAHELAEVCPDAVTGEKDAVDAEGKPQYQGIDVSFLVATLTAAIQELKAEFDAYKEAHP